MDFELLNTADGRIQYLEHFSNKLLAADNWQSVILSREWANSISRKAGVYAIKHDADIVYVGESGSLGGRMKDLLDSRNHTIRRSIGKKYFSKHAEYHKATSSICYAPSIEQLINKFINDKMTVAFIEMPLGRKELEDYLMGTINIKLRLNIRTGRK
jgi:hypothetical protein